MWPEEEKPSAVCIWIEIALVSSVGLVGDQQVMPVEVGAHERAGPQAARKAATSRRTRSWADSSTV